MGMTELSASLAPRSQMNRSFLPFKPMVPSASARFITKGMSTNVEGATPIPILNDRSKNERREMMLKLLIMLLLLKAWKSHKHRDHAANAIVISGPGRAAHAQICK